MSGILTSVGAFLKVVTSGGIVFDAVSSSSTTLGGAASTLTWSHTCTGSSLALFVAVGNIGNAAATISGVTYNGVSMTQLWVADQSGGVEAKGGGFILINPATGAHNVVITLSINGVGYLGGAATSWTGVNQTGTVGNSWRTPVNAPDGSTNPSSVIVTTAVSGDVVVDSYSAFNVAAVSIPNHTSRAVLDPIQSTSYAFGSQSHAATGSTTMSWTNTGGFYSQGAVALIPA